LRVCDLQYCVYSFGDMLFCGIDVGKRCYGAILGKNLLYTGELERALGYDFQMAGIDAPLTISKKFRDCDRELLNMGIKLLPPGWKGMREISEMGIRIAEDLRKKGVEVYEVYPYATRKILSIAPNASKTTEEGKRAIEEDLKRFVDMPDGLTHHELDAVIAALTIKLLKEGKARLVGKRCSIVIPVSPP